MTERARMVSVAVADEINRYNRAVDAANKAGLVLHVPAGETLNAGRPISLMRHDFVLMTGSGFSRAEWHYCNDGRWARLLHLASVERNPLFAEHAWKS